MNDIYSVFDFYIQDYCYGQHIQVYSRMEIDSICQYHVGVWWFLDKFVSDIDVSCINNYALSSTLHCDVTARLEVERRPPPACLPCCLHSHCQLVMHRHLWTHQAFVDFMRTVLALHFNIGSPEVC